jgi:chitodextrinase
MKQFFTLIAAVLLTATTYAQIGINNETPDASSALDITSTTRGFLMPRMTNEERTAISNPAEGLMVYITDFNGGSFMFYNGTIWTTLAFGSSPPNAPIIGAVNRSNGEATVQFTAPSSNGGSEIISYTATSSPGGITGILNQAGSGTITVTGLTNGTAYTFTVTATNAIGTSTASAISNSVTPATVPSAPTIGTVVAGNALANVPFTAPSSNGYSSITSYTATSSPGGITGILNQAGSGTITVTGLTNGTAYTFTVTATNAIGTSTASAISNSVTPQLSVGDSAYGGIIFYVFQSGEEGYVEGEIHGLIAASSDQSSAASWGCNNNGIVGADGTAIGTGEQNTIDMQAAGCATQANTAAYLCINLNTGGYGDWFLPSKDELAIMLSNILSEGNFTYWYYVTSSEIGDKVWCIDKYGDQYNYFPKTYSNFRVRAVRVF